MHCFVVENLCFRFVCFSEYVPRFIKLEMTLNRIPIWHGLIVRCYRKGII